MTEVPNFRALIDSMGALTDADFDSAPDEVLAMLAEGAAALKAHTASETGEAGLTVDAPVQRAINRRRLASVGLPGTASLTSSAAVSALGDLGQLDAVLEELLEAMHADVADMTSGDLELIVDRTDGGTLATTFRSLAAAELDWRESCG